MCDCRLRRSRLSIVKSRKVGTTAPPPPPVPPVSQLKPVVLGDNEEGEEEENEKDNALVIDTGMASVKVGTPLPYTIDHIQSYGS